MRWLGRVWEAVADRFEIVILVVVLAGAAAFVAWQFHSAPTPGADVLRQVACSNPIAKPAPGCRSLAGAS